MATTPTLPPYKKFTKYQAELTLIELSVANVLEPVFDALETAVRALRERISTLAEDEDYEIRTSISDEWGYVDDLLDAAFVVAQRYLTIVTSWTWSLSERVEREIETHWKLPTSKYPLLQQYGPALSGDPSIRFAFAVNAAANFFKHESEWSRPWSSASTSSPDPKERAQAQTFNAVQGFGVDDKCSENPRRIAEGLGVKDYSDLTPLSKGLDQWRTDLLEAVRSELVRLKLL